MFFDSDRLKTRRERYDLKKETAIKMPAAICAISFGFDENIAFLVRSAACFGFSDLFIIGKPPERSFLKSRSGSLCDYISIKSFANTMEFSQFAKDNDYKIIAIELCSSAKDIYRYKFSFDKKIMFLFGNESTGVPGNLIVNNDALYIPMSGPGYCLNVSQAGTVVMNEYSRQYLESLG